MLGWLGRMFSRTDHPTDPGLTAELAAARAQRAEIARRLEAAGIVGQMTHAERILIGLAPDRRAEPRAPAHR